MKDKCYVLILTAQYGNGHLSVAKAVKELLGNNNNNLKIEIKDFFKMTKPKSFQRIYKNYEYIVKYGSWLYNSYYYSKEMFETIKKLDTASLPIYLKLKNILDEINPDIIISTFPTCSGYISKYKEHEAKQIPLITVVTDIVATNEWIYPYTDYYCVATSEMKTAMINKGIARDTILVTGIPLSSSFYNEKKFEYKYDLLNCIPKNKKVLTFLGGGLGLLPDDESFYQWLHTLPNTYSIIVTGKNKDLYERLSETLNYDNVTVLGYTNKMEEIMRRSDVLIGKPGGITLFESIMINVPCIILEPSLGQEKENCKYVTQNQIGLVVKEIEELKEQITDIIEKESFLTEFKIKNSKIKETVNLNLLIDKVNSML